MELTIKEKVAEIVMDIPKFRGSLKSELSILEAVRKSCRVTFNSKNVAEEKLFLIVFGETNWVFFFSKIMDIDKNEAIFRLHKIEFKDRLGYVSNERSNNYSFVSLSPVRKSGTDYILINNLVKTPEAFIDFWLQKRIYNYTKSEFKKVIYEVTK
ncbi:MAG: hypothetical protein AABY15_06230 [Nanoarchaeota archaeon]